MNHMYLLQEHATYMAKNLTALDIHRMKNTFGLNRKFRRSLASKASKGKLTSRDLPLWLVAKHYTYA